MSERIAVAVTGVAVVSALGPDLDSTWDAVLRGERAVRYERPWLEERFREIGLSAYIPLSESNLAGAMHGFDFRAADARIAEAIKAKDVDRFYGGAAQRFIVAAVQAGTMADVFRDNLVIEGDQFRNAVVVGTGGGGSLEMPGFSLKMVTGDKRLPPTALSKNQPENPMIMSAKLLQTKSNNESRHKACASGYAALARGAELIETDQADLVVAGGAEGFNVQMLAEFESTSAASLAVNPDHACLPFRTLRKSDKWDQGGTTVSEGAGVVILERLDRARARGAKILAIVAGHSQTSDAGDMTMLSGEGTERALRDSMRMANLTRDVDLIYLAHGTGAGRKGVDREKRTGDDVEGRVITEKIFTGRKRDYDPHQIARKFIAIKRFMGHALGGANGIEFGFGLKMLQEDLLPPSHLDIPMRYLQDLIPTNSEPEKTKADGFIGNGAGFGGSNASIVVLKPEVAEYLLNIKVA